MDEKQIGWMKKFWMDEKMSLVDDGHLDGWVDGWMMVTGSKIINICLQFSTAMVKLI